MSGEIIANPWADTPVAVTPTDTGYRDANNQDYVRASPTEPGARRAVAMSGPAPAQASPPSPSSGASGEIVADPWQTGTITDHSPPLMNTQDQRNAAYGSALGFDKIGSGVLLPYKPPNLMDYERVAERNTLNSLTDGWDEKLAAGIQSIPHLMDGTAGTAFTRALNRQKGLDAYVNDKAWPGFQAVTSAPGYIAQGLIAPEFKGAGLLAPVLQGATLGALNASGEARGDLGQVAMAGTQGAVAGGLLGGAVHYLGAPVAAREGVSPAYARVGVDPSLAVNGPRSVQQIAQNLKGVPFAGTPLAASADTTANQLDAGLLSKAQSVGYATNPNTGGAAIQTGAESAIKGMRTKADTLYEPINALDQSKYTIPMNHTTYAINQMKADFPNLPDWLAQNAPTVTRMGKALDGTTDGLQFGEARALRTDIGMKLNSGKIDPVDNARLSTLYGALSKDIASGVGDVATHEALLDPSTSIRQAIDAGSKARASLSRADQYYSAAQQRTSDALAPFLGRGTSLTNISDNPPAAEAAFGKVVAAAQGGARADIVRVQQLKRSLDPDAWGNFTAGTISTMGRGANGEDFSAAKFATQYAKLTPEGKAALFGRGGLQSDMDAFAKIAADQQAVSKFYNHSNSGHVGGFIGAAAVIGEGVREGGIHGGLSAAAMVATLGTVGNFAGRLLASPGFARTMLKATSAKPGVVESLFADYARAHPSIAPYVQKFQSALPGVSTATTLVPTQGRSRQTVPQLAQ